MYYLTKYGSAKPTFPVVAGLQTIRLRPQLLPPAQGSLATHAGFCGTVVAALFGCCFVFVCRFSLALGVWAFVLFLRLQHENATISPPENDRTWTTQTHTNEPAKQKRAYPNRYPGNIDRLSWTCFDLGSSMLATEINCTPKEGTRHVGASPFSVVEVDGSGTR